MTQKEVIQNLLKERGLTQGQLAREAGVNEGNLSSALNQRIVLSEQMINRLTDAFNALNRRRPQGDRFQTLTAEDLLPTREVPTKYTCPHCGGEFSLIIEKK